MLADGVGDHLGIWAQWMTCCVVLNHHFDVKFSLLWSPYKLQFAVSQRVRVMMKRGSVCLFILNCKKLLPTPRIQKLWFLCSVVSS